MYDVRYLRIRVDDIERELRQIKTQLMMQSLAEPTPFPITPRTTPIPRSQHYCSFCGKAQEEVAGFIAGPGSVFICNECVELCHEIEQKRLAKLKDNPQ